MLKEGGSQMETKEQKIGQNVEEMDVIKQLTEIMGKR